MLAEDAIKAALSDYRIKQSSKEKMQQEQQNWGWNTVLDTTFRCKVHKAKFVMFQPKKQLVWISGLFT